ncbi:MAG: beta-N-acetylglucosaminidase domain-containing protein [bacterium]
MKNHRHFMVFSATLILVGLMSAAGNCADGAIWPGPIPKPHVEEYGAKTVIFANEGFAVYSAAGLQGAPAHRLLMEELPALQAGGAELRLPGQGSGGLDKIVIGDLHKSSLAAEAGPTQFDERHWRMIEGREQAYLLSFSNAAEGHAVIALHGTDERGLYYGFLTLKQILENYYRFGIAPRAGVIIDWPDFSERLLLEGGSTLWEQNLRMRRLALAADLKMTDYIYEPKSDFKTRRKWRAPYTVEELVRFGEISSFADAHYLKVGYSLNVGLSAHYSSEKTFDAILSKFRAVRAQGIRYFGLFFDDSPPNLPTQADRDRYGRIGVAQADLANRVQKSLNADDPEAQFFFCPTLYWSLDDVQYFRDLKENLDKSIKVGWTGREIVSPTITEEDAAGFRKLIGRPFIVGDNYPEYRWLPQRNRENGLYHEVQGWMTNAPWLSEITLATIADYSWNAEGYDPDDSLRRAVWRLSGPGLYEVMLSIARASESAVTKFNNETGQHSANIKPPEEIQSMLSAVAQAASEGKPIEAPATEAAAWLGKALASSARLRETIMNDELLVGLTGSLYLDELDKFCARKRDAINELVAARQNGASKSEIDALAESVKP